MTPNYNEVGDFAVYNSGMLKSIMDKLFFVDKIEADLIVDFGCADGMLIKYLAQWFPNAQFIGFDNNEEMLKAARNNLHQDKLDVTLTTDWADVEKQLAEAQAAGQKTSLILNSIVHEIYHYLEVKAVDDFWNKVFKSGFDSVVLRDMIPASKIDRLSETNDVRKIYHKFLGSKELSDFEDIYGSISNNKNLVHFLLKYRYVDPNWAREVRENYLPLYRENLLAMIPLEYEVLYEEHYVLPFLKRQIRSDFGIDLKDPTHYKIILEKVK